MNDTSGFRRWWRPPRRIVDRDTERKVTFLELFYDLVYVVLVSQVAHHLSRHVSWTGLAESGFLFGLLWLAWVNGSLYHDAHGNRDVRTRVFTFLQMATVASMAVFAHDAFGHGAPGFALSFAAFQLVMTWLWWRTGVHDPVHQSLSTPYAAISLLSTGAFATSAFVDEATRLGLWGAGLVLCLLGPVLTAFVRPRDPAVRAEQERSLTVTDSSAERFGLLTIIVLGEVIVGVVSGASQTEAMVGTLGLTALLGLSVGFGLWWLYFDLVAQRLPAPGRLASAAWMVLHLPLTAGIAATGAATLDVIEHTGGPLPDEHRWLMAGAVAVTLGAVAGLLWTTPVRRAHRPLVVAATAALVLAVGGTVALGTTGLDSPGLLASINGMLAVPVGLSLAIWITVLGGEEVELT